MGNDFFEDDDERMVERQLNHHTHNMRHTSGKSATMIAEQVLSDPMTAKILRYKFVMGLTGPEIAQLTGISAPAVRKRIERLKEKIPRLADLSH